jgi:DMSO/TMAO reductase YedYZ heme-binding membrane subunit
LDNAACGPRTPDNGQLTMSKQDERTPIWKIIALGLIAVVCGVILIALHAYIKPGVAATQPSDTPARSAMNLASLLLLVGLMCVAVTTICIGWLGYRYYLTIPAWKRRKGPPKRR